MAKKRNIFRFNLNPEKKSATQIGYFSGYASIFNVMDEQGDRVLPGAFVHSLNNWQQAKSFPKMLWQHDPSEPIGKWLKMEEDHRGLYVEGQIILDLQKGREAYALMKNGVIEGLSIGYHVIESQKGHIPGERFLSKVNLVEVSLVTFAANQAAKINAVKSQTSPHSKTIHKIQTLIQKITLA